MTTGKSKENKRNLLAPLQCSGVCINEHQTDEAVKGKEKWTATGCLTPVVTETLKLQRQGKVIQDFENSCKVKPQIKFYCVLFVSLDFIVVVSTYFHSNSIFLCMIQIVWYEYSRAYVLCRPRQLPKYTSLLGPKEDLIWSLKSVRSCHSVKQWKWDIGPTQTRTLL